MTYPDEYQFTITMRDISCALCSSRTTLWRFFRKQEMAYVRIKGVKHYAVSDVITRLRQHPKYRPSTEINLLLIDQQRRQNVKHEAQ